MTHVNLFQKAAESMLLLLTCFLSAQSSVPQPFINENNRNAGDAVHGVNEECNVAYDGSLTNALGPLSVSIMANDFTVDANTTMTVERLTLNVIRDIGTADIYLFENNDGSPGALIASHMGITPSSKTNVGNAFGQNVYEVVIDFPAETLEGGSGSIYWIGLQVTTGGEGEPIGWEKADVNTNAMVHTSNDGGVTWTGSITQDGAFIVSGTCETAGITAGCLEGSAGFALPYTPSCMGMIEVADGLGRVGQYSKVAVTEGTEYTFSLSAPELFITIANEEGTTVLASGTGQVTWTAGFSGMIRYYTHLNSNCESDESTFLTKYVQCDTPIIIEEPDFPCFQGDGLASNDPETGYNIGVGENSFRTADDFIVEEGTTFTVQQVRINVLSTNPPTEFTLNFRSDNAGSPGETEETIVMAPTSQRVVGEENIYLVYEVTLDLETPLVFEAGTYWLQPEAFALVPGTSIFWELSLTGSNGAIIQTSTDHGATWQEDSSGYQAVFFISGECNSAEEGEGCFVTGTSEQWPPQTYEPECSGAVEIISGGAWAGEYSKVEVTAGTQYTFRSSVPTDFITIADEDADVAFATGTGSVTWTSLADQVIRFFTHVDEDCNMEEIPRARTIQCGDIQPSPENDDCDNAIALSCGDSDSGSTTYATDSGGWAAADVFYSYTGTGTPEQITVSLCGSGFDTYMSVYSDCAMTTVVAENDDYCEDQSQVSFLSDGTSTYIIMVEGYSTLSGDYVIELTCSEPYEYDPCSPVIDGSRDTGIGFSDGYAAANDFIVLANTQLNVQKIAFDMITLGGNPTTFDLSFYEGEGGIETPFGQTFTGIAPTSITPNGTYSGFPVYTVELILPETLSLPATADADKRYWVSIASGLDDAGGYTYWLSSLYVESDIDTLPMWQSTDGGDTWGLYTDDFGFNFEGIMSIEGECEELGVNDMNSFDFAYYPNPAKDLLNLHSNKAVENVTVYNMAGQRVLDSVTVKNGQINISTLLEGVYMFRITLEGGQVETFKIVKK